MLFLLLFFIVVSIVGYVMQRASTKYSEVDLWGSIFTTVGIVISLAMILSIPLTHLGYNGNIAAFHQTRKTVNISRKTQALENAALTQKIIESNQWLRRNKYWNNHAFDIYIPDKIDTVTYIR